MANILILGAGAMSSAFSTPCSDKGHNVTIVGTHLENDFIDKMQSIECLHPALNLKLPKKVKLKKYEEFNNEINKKIDLIVLGVNSKGIEWASNEISKCSNNKVPILMLTKGLSIFDNNYQTLLDKVKLLLENKKFNNPNISVVGGPCLASGLAHRVHSSVIFANLNLNRAKFLKDLLSNDYYHISVTDDVIGVEVCAAIKNIFSMAVGASEGLCSNKISSKYKEINFLNTAASVIRQSIYEMNLFTTSLHGKSETVSGLAGLGDLYVSSAGGRNSKMGKYIGHGMSYSQAKKEKMKNITVEGADLAFEIGSKVKKDFNIRQTPILLGMIDAICDDKSLKIEWNFFNENLND